MSATLRIGVLGLLGLVTLTTWIAQARGDLIDRLLPVIRIAESSGDPLAVGNGSYGLYQITPVLLKHYNDVHGSSLTVDDLFLAETSEMIARWYLSWIDAQLSRRGYHNDIPRIIYCWNTGIGKLRSNGYQIPAWTIDHPNLIYRSIYRNGGLS